MLIAIEGTDASGKNTQTKLLCDRLVRSGRTVELFSFPRYETPVGQVIRAHLHGAVALMREGVVDAADPLMFQALMLTDKYLAAAHIREVLRAGGVVVCDRWIPSSQCYGKADGLDPAWLDRMHSSLPQADLNIFIDVPVEEAMKRRPEARDRYEQDREKQKAVRKNYEALWRNPPAGAGIYRTVNGVGTIEEVAERIWLGGMT